MLVCPFVLHFPCLAELCHLRSERETGCHHMGLTVARLSSISSTRSKAAVLVSASSSSVPTSNTLSRYAWIWTCSLSLSVCFSLWGEKDRQINSHYLRVHTLTRNLLSVWSVQHWPLRCDHITPHIISSVCILNEQTVQQQLNIILEGLLQVQVQTSSDIIIKKTECSSKKKKKKPLAFNVWLL